MFSAVSELGRFQGIKSGISRRRMAAVRAQQVLALHVAGLTPAEIARKLDVSRRTIWRDLLEIEDAQIRVEEIIEDCGLDADDVHITLSRMHDADLADICDNPDDPIEKLRFKPLSKWPPIWRQGLAGKIRMTPVTMPDGKRTEGGDQVSYKIEIERESLLKILELSAKLKAVDALVKPEAGDVNIVVITAEKARQVAGAKKRLALIAPKE